MNQPSQYAGAFTSVLWFCAVLGMTVTAKVKATTEGTLLHNPTCPAEYALVLDTAFSSNAGVTAAMQVKKPSRVFICQSISTDKTDGLARLFIQLWSDKTGAIAQTTIPLDIEGQLRNIQQINPAYVLHPDGFSLALTLDTRAHEVDYDKHNQELWLFWFDGTTIRLVFNTSINMQQWATNCGDSCEDSVNTVSTLEFKSAAPDSFANLTVHKRTEVFPQGDKTQQSEVFQETGHYVFNGKNYETVE